MSTLVYSQIMLYSDPFTVGFVEATYTVDESVGAVNICVNLTQPMGDILDETVNVFVIDDSSSIHIPPNASLASELITLISILFTSLIGYDEVSSFIIYFKTPFPHFLAADAPNFLSIYNMEEGTDFAQQTNTVNDIDDILIREENRIICYHQPIYEDLSLEQDEYAGLSLGVRDNALTTIATNVKSMYDQTSILILDNDNECQAITCISLVRSHLQLLYNL